MASKQESLAIEPNGIVGTTALVKREEPTMIHPLIQLSMNKDMDVDKLKELFKMQVEWEKLQQKKQYDESFAEFKKDVPEITKNKHVNYTTKVGIEVDYW